MIALTIRTYQNHFSSFPNKCTRSKCQRTRICHVVQGKPGNTTAQRLLSSQQHKHIIGTCSTLHLPSCVSWWIMTLRSRIVVFSDWCRRAERISTTPSVDEYSSNRSTGATDQIMIIYSARRFDRISSIWLICTICTWRRMGSQAVLRVSGKNPVVEWSLFLECRLK